MICGNCRFNFDEANGTILEPMYPTKCRACESIKTRGSYWIYCEGCASDLGCCESCGDMVFKPKRPDLVKQLGSNLEKLKLFYPKG